MTTESFPPYVFYIRLAVKIVMYEIKSVHLHIDIPDIHTLFSTGYSNIYTYIYMVLKSRYIEPNTYCYLLRTF